MFDHNWTYCTACPRSLRCTWLKGSRVSVNSLMVFS
nr:MAG TPA_asm: hypothetical protein [Bacteriophage sp.]